MAQWQPLQSNKMLRKENTFEDGVDTQNNAFFISENAYSSGYGFDTDLYPVLATRRGRTALGTSGGAITRLLTNFGTTQLIRAVGTALQYWNGSAWTAIAGTFANVDWSAANFDIGGPVVILTNETDTPRYWNGSALASIAAMPKGKYIAADNRRVYTAGVTGDLDTIHYCAFQDALDWTTAENSGVVQFYTANGGPVTGLHAFEGQIYAFKKDAFCQIFHTGDARVTHRLVEVSNDIGCVSDKTIVEVGPYLLWLGDRDAFICAGGSAVSIGEPVREILQSINPSALTEACAWTDDYRYYLCIPTGSSTSNDTELVYDTRYKKWHVRSINLGGMRYGTLFNNIPYGGWTSGMTYRLNNGTTDEGVAIPYQLVSKPYDEGVGEAEKEYYELHIQGYIDTGSTMDVSISVNDRGSSFTLLDSLDDQTVSQNKNIIVPMDTVPLTHWMRYMLSGEGYVEVNKMQRYSRVQPVQI
jgi:hypothetical protein